MWMRDGINVSYIQLRSDTPGTRPETDKAGQSPRGRRWEGKLSTVEKDKWTNLEKKKAKKLICLLKPKVK